jgi:hypothetical protein
MLEAFVARDAVALREQAARHHEHLRKTISAHAPDPT